MSETVKFKGVSVIINGKEYIMPPLSPYAYAKYGAMEKIACIEKEIKELNKTQQFGAISPDAFLNLIQLVHLALKRNYPEITEDEIGEGIPDGVGLMSLFQDLISQDEKARQTMDEHVKNVQKQQAKTER